MPETTAAAAGPVLRARAAFSAWFPTVLGAARPAIRELTGEAAADW